MSARETIGMKVKLARVMKDISLKQLSKFVGFSDVTLSRIERGKVSPTIEQIQKIAFMLERPVDYFLVPGEEVLGETVEQKADYPIINSIAKDLKHKARELEEKAQEIIETAQEIEEKAKDLGEITE